MNSLVAGAIATEMFERAARLNPALRERVSTRAPLGRVGRTTEVAWPIVVLLSDAAGFMTGQTLIVDGGRLAAGSASGREAAPCGVA